MYTLIVNTTKQVTKTINPGPRKILHKQAETMDH